LVISCFPARQSSGILFARCAPWQYEWGGDRRVYTLAALAEQKKRRMAAIDLHIIVNMDILAGQDEKSKPSPPNVICSDAVMIALLPISGYLERNSERIPRSVSKIPLCGAAGPSMIAIRVAQQGGGVYELVYG
jgi:hypothetical protein